MHASVARVFGSETAASSLPSAAAVAKHARELAALAIFGVGAALRRDARLLILRAARSSGIAPASIAPLYEARGRGELPSFTVPAINVRGMTFDVAAAAFRVMKSADAGMVVFELNRAEVAFTDQRPREFSMVIFAAALAEGWAGPVFIQLDHLMANAAAYRADPEAELGELEALITAAISAGFYNIDIDASTLVDLLCETVAEQQRPNIEVTARLAQGVRALEPRDVRISIGGEIGEVGGHNSTPEELHEFVRGLAIEMGDGSPPGQLSKVSVQTGTRHGGVRLPDGGIANVTLDFETLETLSLICRNVYGMAGAVQHGASTLPQSLFSRFVEVGCAEVHLATGFQDAVLDHPAFPGELRAAMESWTLAELKHERNPGETDVQFVRRARRKAWGPFKQACWDVDDSARAEIFGSLEERFASLFESLNVTNTRELASRHALVPKTQHEPR